MLDYSWNIQRIIDYFIYEYSIGRTPNPCVMCNTELKFSRLLAYARQTSADYLATGHYARITTHNGSAAVARAHATDKDQSYVLFGIARANLSSILLPNGEMPSKHAVRSKAAQLNLPVHDKQDSQEICFVTDDDYASFLLQRQSNLNIPGPIVDPAGKTIGQHHGLFRYTIGQRRGLGIAAGEPLYVIAIDPQSNTLVAGPRQALAKQTLLAAKLNWHRDPPPPGTTVRAQIRYNHRAAPAEIQSLTDDSVVIHFAEPQYAITAGQAVVFYDDNDIIIGGGWITCDEAS